MKPTTVTDEDWWGLRVSNLIYMVTLGIPIMTLGILMANKPTDDCQKSMAGPAIALGVYLMILFFAGLIAACCRLKWLLRLQFIACFLLALVVLSFVCFTFSNARKEYQLGDYSNSLQKRVNTPQDDFFQNHLSPIQEIDRGDIFLCFYDVLERLDMSEVSKDLCNRSLAITVEVDMFKKVYDDDEPMYCDDTYMAF